MDTDSVAETYRFATWNIDQARQEEAFEATRFDVRWPCIKAQIKAYDPDLLCLQELRNLETSAITVPRLLYEMAELGYDYKHAYYGPDQIAFCQAIFFKRDKFFPTAMDLLLLPLADEGKPNMSYMVLSLRLRSLSSGKHLTVCTTHFGVEEEGKYPSACALAEYFDLHPIMQGASLCAGDFNFFDDRGGGTQRAVLLAGLDDLAHPLANASGSFMGYPRDHFRQPYEKMSRLDHIFARGGVKRVGEASAFGDMEQVRARTYPSDHLMIVIEIAL